MDRVATGYRKRNTKKKDRLGIEMQINLLLLFLAVLICSFILMVRMYVLGRDKGVEYEQRVLSQQSYVSNTIYYRRGGIYDRNGLPLAKSDKYFNVILDPKILLGMEDSVEVTLDALVDVFGLDRDGLEQVLKEKPNSSYVVLLKNVEFDKTAEFEQRVEQAKEESRVRRIAGVYLETTYIRDYPYGSLASNVIGFANSAGDALYGGLEQYYANELSGTNGRMYGYYDSALNIQHTEKAAINGNNLMTTIDVYIQGIVEKYIKEFNDVTGCDNIGILLMNPNNGEIYAMASNEGYDLNNPYDISRYYGEYAISNMSTDQKLMAAQEMWKNFCVSYNYVPGSAFKPFTVAAAMEEDFISRNNTYTCLGTVRIGESEIRCNNIYGHGTLTLVEAITKSCNPALIEIGERLGRDYFYKYQLQFGFGKKTGIDLSGEESGIINLPGRLNVTELATCSFGQGFVVTMVQLASAYCSLVNGGYYYKPHVVREVTNENGSIIYEADTRPVKETVSQSVSKFIRDATYLTVESGTATPAKMEGYLVGGKTGTAQKPATGDDKDYVVSFIGSVPADNPEIVIYIVIDEIHDELKEASSSVATEMANRILREVLPLVSIFPKGEIDYQID